MNALSCATLLTLLSLAEIGRADPLDNWWVQHQVGLFPGLQDIAYGNGQFVAVGGSSLSPGGLSWIMSSTDGVNWAGRQSGTTSLYFSGIVYGNGQFVVGSNRGTIVTSADGVNWFQRESATADRRYGITYGSGQFVAVGDGGTILASSDGMNWAVRQPGMPNWLSGGIEYIAYVNGQFVAVGYSGSIVTSADGVNWVLRQAEGRITFRALPMATVNLWWWAIPS